MNKNTAEWEQLQDKLSALKNLADKPGTAGEAAAATAALQRLLFKHNLSMADIAVEDKEDYAKEMYEVGVEHDTVKTRWKYDLLSIVARNNFCQALHYSSGVKRAPIVGEPHNIAGTIAMYEYLRDELNRLMRRDLKAAKETGTIEGPSSKWRLSYRRAALREISKRLHEQRTTDIKTYTGGSNLVVAKEAELQNALAKFFPQTKPSRATGSSKFDPNGALAGRLAGQSVSLNKQVSSGAGSKGPKALGGGK